MSLMFKLYRIFTALALMITGFFTFAGVFSVFTVGFIPLLILSVMAWGACFIHSVLSIYLQRSLLLPEVVLKENTPGGIRIMGVITVLWGGLLFVLGAGILAMPPEAKKDVIQQLGADNPAILTPMGIVFLLIGFILTFNANLSFRFLREWTRREEGGEEE